MENLERNEIISISPQDTQLDLTEDILAAANRRITQLDQIVTLALKRTNENDWVDQQGKPYLTCSGAERIARLFGVNWRKVECEKVFSSDEAGQYYFYEYRGEFYLGRDIIHAVGTCSQKDAFFAKTKNGMKPASEIDETNIRKAAYSNMVVNGVSRLLGIRNLTWEQVKKAGIDPDKAARVTYDKKEQDDGKISQAQFNRFYAIYKASGKSEQEVNDYMAQFNVKDPHDLKVKDYNNVIKWLEGK